MAKKNLSEPGTPMGKDGTVCGYESPPVPDNNPAGPSRLPDHELRAYRHSSLYPNQICFPENIGKGEADGGDDVNVVNANGISNSRNKGRGMQYNYGNGLSGKWNKNEDWDGGNLSGL